MADFRAELQLLLDAAESFTEPALGHYRPWAKALDRARAALAEEAGSIEDRIAKADASIKASMERIRTIAATPESVLRKARINPSPIVADEVNTLLQAIKSYIEETEVRNDDEWGSGRTLQELLDARLMPDIYWQVLDHLAEGAGVGPTDEELIRRVSWMLDGSVYDNDSGDIAREIRGLITDYGTTHPRPIPVADTRYEFAVLDCEDEEQAGGSAATLADAIKEGNHYLALYSNDDGCGPYRLELREVRTLPAAAIPLPQQENKND